MFFSFSVNTEIKPRSFFRLPVFLTAFLFEVGKRHVLVLTVLPNVSG